MTDQIVIHKPQEGDDPAHVAAMVAKADGQPAPDANKPADPPAGDSRPAWLPEKFKSAEDMAKAYAELEAKQSGKPAEAPAEKPQGDQQGTDQVSQELANKGLDLNEFNTEWSQKGELSAESYEKLEKAGYPKNLVDQYIAGQKALGSQFEVDVKSAAGSPEKFGQVSEWAAANLTRAEIDAYNAAIDSGDVAKAKLAVAGITQKYDAANPSEGNLIGGRAATSSGDVYESVAQVTKDMGSPEYKSDPAFRKKVQDKIARSKVL
jgi:hypothetical protein